MYIEPDIVLDALRISSSLILLVAMVLGIIVFIQKIRSRRRQKKEKKLSLIHI